MAKTIIIVEDDSDKYTFEAIIRHMELANDMSVIDTSKVEAIEWKKIPDENNPEKPTALIRGLKGLLNDISNEKYDKVGIIRDIDSSNKANKLLLINNALKEAYPNEAKELTDTNTLVPFQFVQNSTENILTIDFACHFVSLNGQGEIEDILKAIKNLPSPIADCVDKHLPECLKMNEEELREKELVKLWFNNYQRYDNLPKSQRTSSYTSIENIMKNRTDLFDFDKDIPELVALKSFLRMMK